MRFIENIKKVIDGVKFKTLSVPPVTVEYWDIKELILYHDEMLRRLDLALNGSTTESTLFDLVCQAEKLKCSNGSVQPDFDVSEQTKDLILVQRALIKTNTYLRAEDLESSFIGRYNYGGYCYDLNKLNLKELVDWAKNIFGDEK